MKQIAKVMRAQEQPILDLDSSIDNAKSALPKVTQQIAQLIDAKERAPTDFITVFMFW
jgi:phage shock protein A